jgi:glycosyltransferase involved in cell wall biosynthesis
MPHGITAPDGSPMPRSELGIPDDSYVFFFMYDIASYQERKNPEGTIHAFQRAFGPDSKVTLLIKLSHVHFRPESVSILEKLAVGWPNIRFLKQPLDRLQVGSLMRACDCFVSLHRSEGFGLGPAEALAIGKPVIATDWSSTTDFVRPEHACPVGYRLVPVGENVGPYEAWQQWGEPDLDEAAEWMRRLANHPETGRELGRKAAAFMADEFSARRAGDRMRRRLLELGALDPQ